MDEKVIDLCVDHTAEQSRDVRRMVDLIRVCGEVAEADGSGRVKVEHFGETLKRFEVDYYRLLFDGLADMQMHILRMLAWLAEIDGVGTASTSQLYDRYREMVGGSVPSYRRVAGVLKELEVMNLIGGRTVSRGREDRSGEVWLKVPARTILEYLGIDWKRIKDASLKLETLRSEIEILKRRRLRS